MEGKLTRFLHGTLEATIFDATKHMPSSPFSCICLGGKPAYVTLELGKTRVAETNHDSNGIWNQTFRILCAHPADSVITITLRTSHSVLGRIQMPAHTFIDGGHESYSDSLFPLLSKKGKLKSNLKLRFCLRFTHAESEVDLGLKNGVTFPLRSNCEVILYQDAHHRSLFQPPIRSPGRQMYRPRRLWEDVYRAIDGAKHLIYIAGWSLNPKLALVRDHQSEIPDARGVSIGELLKRKADEGVAVRIMLWDDETSLHSIKNQGVMRTHDEDSFNYFKHTKVVCRLFPRLRNHLPTLFAHHQKTITVDAHLDLLSISHNNDEIISDDDIREIISFIGGLDLCDGRYDTEEHSLFRTLNTESHANDFYQINFSGASIHRGGPREPWHDTHTCIMGTAAHDVLTNFEERWTEQCNPSSLVSVNAISNFLCPTFAQSRHKGNSWNVQVFRSIDRHSTRYLPRNISVECSIHEAYVHAIRRAERFIYIENQYFLGSCHLWDKDQHSGCKNLIPVEIALKVVSKIRARERFAVYILIPMWPEGIPESEPVQDILHWTRLTMTMMYRLIGEAITDSRLDAHPRDYLNFFCLANREKMSSQEFIPPSSPENRTQYWKAQRNRRFMIYVHSKLMIVDDAFILIGSANVNQRSMDGQRDTEIALGCNQQDRMGGKSRYGDIHAYRMSLWYEHIGHIEEAYLKPENVDCVRRLCKIGDHMWNVYSGEALVDMEGVHLVSYPISISEDGSITDLEGTNGTFPDTTALIKGSRSMLLPPACTT